MKAMSSLKRLGVSFLTTREVTAASLSSSITPTPTGRGRLEALTCRVNAVDTLSDDHVAVLVVRSVSHLHDGEAFPLLHPPLEVRYGPARLIT
jgi:hypothetical protein